MYIFVNNDLKMGKGKIGAQIGHGVQYVMEELLNNGPLCKKKHQNDYSQWIVSGCTKLVLKANQSQLCHLYDKYHQSDTWCKKVIDAGHTQIEAGSFTCLIFTPMKRGSINEFDQYKLL